MSTGHDSYIAGRRAGVPTPTPQTLHPPWRQPRGKLMVYSVNSHTNATRIGWHLWEIDLRFASGLPPGWPTTQAAEPKPNTLNRSRDREFFIDNLLVRIHFITVMIWWTGLAPWEFKFSFPGSCIPPFLGRCHTTAWKQCRRGHDTRRVGVDICHHSFETRCDSVDSGRDSADNLPRTKAKHPEQEQTCRLISSQARVEAKVSAYVCTYI